MQSKISALKKQVLNLYHTKTINLAGHPEPVEGSNFYRDVRGIN